MVSPRGFEKRFADLAKRAEEISDSVTDGANENLPVLVPEAESPGDAPEDIAHQASREVVASADTAEPEGDPLAGTYPVPKIIDEETTAAQTEATTKSAGTSTASKFLHQDRPSRIEAEHDRSYAEVLRSEGNESQHAYGTVLDKIVDDSNVVSETFVAGFLEKLQTLPKQQREKVADALQEFSTLTKQIEDATEEEQEIWKAEYVEALNNNDITSIAQNNPFAQAGLLVAAIDVDSEMQSFAGEILHHIKTPDEVPSHRNWKTNPITKATLNGAATSISFVATYAGIKATLTHLFNSNPDALDQFNQILPGALSANGIAVALALLGSGLVSGAIYRGRNAVISESFKSGKGFIRSTAALVPQKPIKMTALAAGLGLSTMYADIGVTNIFANMHLTEQTGRKAQKDPKLREAIKNAQEVRERLNQYIAQFKEFLQMSAKLEAIGVDKLSDEERKQYEAMVADGWKFPAVKSVGAGPLSVYKGYVVGENVEMDPKYEKTGRPKYDKYKDAWDERSKQLGLDSPNISSYAEKLLAEVNIEDTVARLETEVRTITGALKELDEQAAWNTVMAVGGISNSDAYTIPNSVRKLEKAIIDATGEVNKLNTDVIPKIEKAYAEAMAVIYGDKGGQSLSLKRPNISLQSLPGAPGEYWKKFRSKAEVSMVIAPETAYAANAYLTRFGLPPEAFKTNYFWAYITFISSIYLVVDAGVTAWLARHERKRKKKFDEEVPNALDKLSDTENLLAEQVSTLFNNKLAPMAHSLLGMQRDQIPLVTVGYIRSRMRSVAIDDVPELKRHEKWLSTFKDGDDSYLAELSIQDRDAYNAYTEWVEQWQNDIESNPTKLAGLLADLYPQYEGMLDALSGILSNADDTYGNIEKVNEMRESVRGIHRETLRERAQLLARRITAANVIMARIDTETKTASRDASMEQLKSPDIVLPLQPGERISFTLNQARAFMTYQTIAQRREADLKELEQAIRSGSLLEFTAFAPDNTRQGLTVPPEFTQDFLYNARSSFSADEALLEGIVREQDRELYGSSEEVDPDKFSEQVNFLNANALEKVRATIAADTVLSGFQLQTSYNTDQGSSRPTITLTLRDSAKNETYVHASYPGRVPHLGVTNQELSDRFVQWFEQSGHTELLASSFINAKKIERRALQKELAAEYPDMKIKIDKNFTPGDLEKIVRFSVLEENINAMEERLSEDLIEYPLTQSDIDAFYDENIGITGIRSFTDESLAKVFNEINEEMPEGVQAEFSIDSRKLHVFRPKSAGNAEVHLYEYTSAENLLEQLPPVGKK